MFLNISFHFNQDGIRVDFLRTKITGCVCVCVFAHANVRVYLYAHVYNIFTSLSYNRVLISYTYLKLF